MADGSMRITNWPDSGSHERVAYDLWAYLRGFVPKEGGKTERITQYLELYVACRKAAYGNTGYDLSKLS